jgi:hypothetical protein
MVPDTRGVQCVRCPVSTTEASGRDHHPGIVQRGKFRDISEVSLFASLRNYSGFELGSFYQGVAVIYCKGGGNTTMSSHSEWLLTVPTMPDVINFKAVPITSLIKGVAGAGYLSHAINLYLRCKNSPVICIRLQPSGFTQETYI